MKHYSFYIFLLLFTLITSQTPLTSRKFQWQIHSFNDPQELTQLLRKGTTHFKIDLYYVPHSECYTTDPRANQDPRGCFLLTHDKPVPSTNYNTIYHYLDELLLHKSHFSPSSLLFNLALCFKSTPPDICTTDTSQWLPLVDDLYIYITNFLHSNSLSIQIIYDGMKSECVLPKWEKWIYTWIRGRDPAEAFYSDDTDLYYDKFAVFNSKDVRLEEDALRDWGKFKHYERPLQVWEPNHQEHMLHYGKVFVEHEHKGGYVYAINVDVAMFQVYTAGVSGENMNWNLIDDRNVSMRKNVFKVVNGKWIYLFRGGENKVEFYMFVPYGNNVTLVKSVNNVNVPSYELEDAVQLNEKVFMIHDIKGEYCLYEIDNNRMEINKWKCGSFMEIIKNGLNQETITYEENRNVVTFSNRGTHLFTDISIITSSLSFIKNNTAILVYSTNKNEINTVTITLNADTLSLSYISFHHNIISTESDIEHIENKCTSKHCLLLIKEKYNKNIMSHLYKYNLDTNEIVFISSPYKNFGVGKYFSLSVREENESVDKFIFVKDNAFPYHSEEQNKDAYMKMCDQKEKFTPHILNYIYGDLSEDSVNNEDYYSSVCNHDVISGTYDMGDNPRVEFYKKEDGSYGFIEMHDGINDDMLELNIIVGLSKFYEGIVVDSWDVGDVAVKREEIH